jgi:hypothetical protein
MTRYYYNKYPIYDTLGYLVNMYLFKGTEHDRPVPFPNSIKIMGGFITRDIERDVSEMERDERLTMFVHLLIRYGLIMEDVHGMFKQSKISLKGLSVKNNEEIFSLMRETTNAVDSDSGNIHAAMVDYGKGMTPMNRRSGDSIDDIISLHLPPAVPVHVGGEDRYIAKYIKYKMKYMMRKYGSNVPLDLSDMSGGSYHKYMKYKNKYVRLGDR